MVYTFTMTNQGHSSPLPGPQRSQRSGAAIPPPNWKPQAVGAAHPCCTVVSTLSTALWVAHSLSRSPFHSPFPQGAEENPHEFGLTGNGDAFPPRSPLRQRQRDPRAEPLAWPRAPTGDDGPVDEFGRAIRFRRTFADIERPRSPRTLGPLDEDFNEREGRRMGRPRSRSPPRRDRPRSPPSPLPPPSPPPAPPSPLSQSRPPPAAHTGRPGTGEGVIDEYSATSGIFRLPPQLEKSEEQLERERFEQKKGPQATLSE